MDYGGLRDSFSQPRKQTSGMRQDPSDGAYALIESILPRCCWLLPD